jgi:hypothetical protein
MISAGKQEPIYIDQQYIKKPTPDLSELPEQDASTPKTNNPSPW